MIGGTGMLRPAVHRLLERGLEVVVVARRPDRAVPDGVSAARLVPVTASWDQPRSLVDAVLAATGGRRVSRLVVWVHSPHREAVMRELERVTAADAVVIRVWGSADDDPRHLLPGQSDLPGRTVRDVVLGYAEDPGGSRWLTHAEISGGVLEAMEQPHELRVVGQIDPWDRRP